jgi:hypothetical protein
MSPIVGNTSSEGKKPSIPTIGSATSSTSTTADVTFTEPTYKGKSGSVTYTVVSNPGSITATGTSPVTVTGLTTGTGYTFFVYATTNYGVSSDNSSSSNSVTPRVMDANYVISGGNGSLYYSIDLQSWSSVSGINSFNSAFYVNSKFYVSDGQGTGAYSTNGISWTTVSNSAFSGTRIAYANSKFVARGYGTAIYVSTDFITWTARTGAANYSYYGAVNRAPFYFGGKWYTNAPSSKILEFSTDTVTWSKTSINAPAMPYDAYWAAGTFFGTYFYALDASFAGSTCGYLYRSTDGNSWSTVTTPWGTLGDASAQSITSSNGRIFIAAKDTSYTQNIYTSTNGTTWTTATIPASTNVNGGGVAYGNGKWIIFGSDDGSVTMKVLSSTNGTSFSLNATVNNNFPTVMDGNGSPLNFSVGYPVYGNKFVMTAQASDWSNWPPTSYNTFRSSTDAVTWSSWSSPISRNGYGFGSVFYANGYYAVGANDGYNDANNVAYSTNATSWTKVAGPTGTQYGSIVAGVNNTFIWAGVDSVIYTSTNATTWTQRSTQISGYWAVWSYGNGRYLAADLNNTPNIVYSTNLTTWSYTTYSGAMTPELKDYYTASNGTTAVFIPNNPNSYVPAYSTTNGTSWTTSDLYVSGWTAISNPAYGNGVFVVAVDGTGMFVSSNGANWTQYSFPDGSNKPDNIDFSGSKFYATGSNYGSIIYTSTNAITWTANSATGSTSFGYAEFPQMRVVGKL